MSINDLVKMAVEDRNHVAAGKLAYALRFTRRMSYSEIYEFVNKRHPIALPEWEAMMYRCDEEDK